MLPRRFFACPSEDKATIDLTAEILDCSITPAAKREESYPFVGIDMYALCRNCNMVFDFGALMDNRTVQLTTLNVGTVDKRCPRCRTMAFYDGRDTGVFCISDRTAVTRELLDTWLYGVCCVGNTFRDTFSSWKAKATSASAKIVSGGLLPTLKRRQGSKAFTCFLSRLKFPTKSELDGLFSCSKCSTLES